MNRRINERSKFLYTLKYRYIANKQFKEDRVKRPKILQVNDKRNGRRTPLNFTVSLPPGIYSVSVGTKTGQT